MNLRSNRAVTPRRLNLCALTLTLCSGSVLAAPPGVRHVRAGAPGGDGLTWETAYSDLAGALQLAASSGGAITELWVKEGTYIGSFTLVPSVGVYGGFAGTETERDQSDPAAHVTTLSGQLSPTTRANNVVIGAGNANTVLGGFTIRDGYAAGNPGSGTTWAGAGIHVTGSPTIRDCTITANMTARYFGADGHPIVRNGGGVYCAPGSAATFIDCRITGNINDRSTAYHLPAGRGAGLSAESCAVTLIGCLISSNTTGTSGWYGCSGGSPAGGGDGGDGGGLHFTGTSALIQDCTIFSNSTGTTEASPACGGTTQCGTDGRHGGKGGGVYADGSTVLMVNTQIAANFTGPGGPGPSGFCAGDGGNGGDGGGIYSANTSMTLINCALDGNRTGEGGSWAGFSGTANGGDGGDGAGVWASGGEVRLVNCTITKSFLGGGQPGTPAGHGGIPSIPAGIAGQKGTGATAVGATVHLENCIAWNTLEINELVGATAAYSDVRGQVPPPGPGNIIADPRFVNPVAGDFHLQTTSPCIDAGNSTPAGVTLPATDFDGLPRRVDIASIPDTGVGAPVVDMGTYEVQNPCAADLNGDGLIDFSDYLEFLNLYDAQDPRADFNGDGLVDFTDYLDFLNHYDAGC